MCQLGHQRSYKQFMPVLNKVSVLWFSFLLWLRIICMLLLFFFQTSNSVCFRNTWLSFLLMYFKGLVFCSLCTLFSFIKFHLIGFPDKVFNEAYDVYALDCLLWVLVSPPIFVIFFFLFWIISLITHFLLILLSMLI